MNKILLTVVFSISISIGFSQALYFNVSGGYGAPALQQTQQGITFQPNGTDPAESIIVPLINQNISDSALAKFKENKYQGYTTGGNLNLTIGYMINPYVGFEIGFGSLIGKKITGKTIYDNLFLGDNVTVSTRTWSYGITMSPGIRFHACKPDAKLVPYGRFALSLPFWGATIHELNIDAPKFSNQGRAIANVRSKTESAISVGFNGSIGLGYNITKWVRIYGEANAQYLFVRSAKTTLEKYQIESENANVNNLLKAIHGNDFDGNILASKNTTTFSKEVVFVDKLDENSNTTDFGKERDLDPNNVVANPVDEDSPREELRRAANFSAFGFAIGFAFTINNKMWKKKQKPVPVSN